MVPNARFYELLADIEPSPTTVSQASAAHNSVRDHLRTHPTFNERWVRAFLAGSTPRDTALRPKSTDDGIERPDVDVCVVTSFNVNDDPTAVLEELRDALEDGGFTIERVNKRSVRVSTSTAIMDIVPLVPSGGIFALPDRDLGYWKLTDPPGHNSWSGQQNVLVDGRFKPLVKLLKTFRRENETGKRPKGFVLEVLASQYAPKTETHYGEAFAQLLEGIDRAYGVFALLKVKPSISDPAIASNDILSKVSMTDWLAFMDKVRVHAGFARRAQQEGDMEEATRLWRRVFGPRFKATFAAAKAASAVSYGNSTADSYSFPNVSAAPTKPRGFA